MSDKYKIRDNESAYFVTLTAVGWIDIFTRLEQRLALVESLKYCQKNRGLLIYGWCLMPSHLHMICQAREAGGLSPILRDFKKFTSKQVIKIIMEEPESRNKWILDYFSKAGKQLKQVQGYKVWQNGNHAIEIYSNQFLFEKLDYIHTNPVKDMIVLNPEDYLFSSARNYAELDSMLDVELIVRELKTYR